jgi:hypothetical protein
MHLPTLQSTQRSLRRLPEPLNRVSLGLVMATRDDHRSPLPLRHRQHVDQGCVASEGSACLLATRRRPPALA